MLKNYLSQIEKQKPEIIENIKNHIVSEIDFADISETATNDIAKIELQNLTKFKSRIKQGSPVKSPKDKLRWLELDILNMENPFKEIRKRMVDSKNGGLSSYSYKPDKTMLLNFNYTKTVELYIDKDSPNITVNYIHGKLSDCEDENLIFGYGDELDDEFDSLEKLSDNRYLKNIKSINYLQNSRYKKLLNLVNEDYFQILIFGHSCGISDRTLLNSIFEHSYCASIKFYFHRRKNGTDNYKDIMQNLSRNFINKSKMRDIVVNKEYTSALC